VGHSSQSQTSEGRNTAHLTPLHTCRCPGSKACWVKVVSHAVAAASVQSVVSPFAVCHMMCRKFAVLSFILSIRFLHPEVATSALSSTNTPNRQ